jgi:hypothetical protein
VRGTPREHLFTTSITLEEQLKEELEMSYEEALTFGDDDIDDHWETYRDRFLQGEYP